MIKTETKTDPKEESVADQVTDESFFDDEAEFFGETNEPNTDNDFDDSDEQANGPDTGNDDKPGDAKEPPEGDTDPAGDTDATGEDDEPADGFGDDILARAESIGLSKEEARAFGKPEALEKALSHFDRQLANVGTPPPGTLPPQAPGNEGEYVPSPHLEKMLDPENEYDPDLVAAMVAQDKQFQAMNNGMAQRDAAAQEAADIEYEAKYDSILKEVGSESLYGKGPTSKLHRNSSALTNRIQTNAMAQSIMKNAADAGLPVPTLADAVGRAHRAMFPQEFEKQVREGLTKKIDKRGNQTIHKPFNRKSKSNETGENEARDWVRQQLAEWGETDNEDF